ncbi:MAG: RHS repeat-associated core domain-containing protein [Myxococcota bacterium]
MSKHGHVDISLESIESRFEFTRFYTSSETEWRRADGVKDVVPPFGFSSSDSSVVNWSHSLFSFVRENGYKVIVRHTNGRVLRFSSSTAVGFMDGDLAAQEIGARLERLTTGYVLYDGNRRFEYGLRDGSIVYLTAIRDMTVSANRSAIAQLIYSDGMPLGNGAYDSGCGGLVIDRVQVGSYTLGFGYIRGQAGECLLRKISYPAASGVIWPPNSFGVLFEYGPNGGLSRAHGGPFFASASVFDEEYEYPETNGSFVVKSYGSARIEHLYGSFNGQSRVSKIKESVDGVSLPIRESFVSVGCAPNTSCLASQITWSRSGSLIGDGTGTTAPAQTYSVTGSFNSSEDFRVTSNSLAPIAWSIGPDGHQSAVTRGGRVLPTSWTSSQNASVPKVVDSTTDDEGNPHHYTWVWGAGNTPLVGTVTTNSVAPAAKVVQTYSWNLAKNILLAQFTRGLTTTYSGGAWSPVERVVGTFYRTTPSCGAGAGVADAQDRVVEVHGPCFVGDEQATKCASGKKYSIARTVYDATGAVVAQQLFPNAETTAAGTVTCGAALTTSYSDFTETRESPHAAQRVEAPNGDVSTLSYDALGRLSSVTRDGKIWQLSYNGGKLASISTPDGYTITYCFRPYSAMSGCDWTGPLSTRLTALAISNNTEGSKPSEAVLFSYADDGSLIKTEAINADGDVRQVQRQESTPAGDLTFKALGELAAGGVSVATFDAEHRRVGFAEGEGAWVPPAFCGKPLGSNSPVDPRCTAVEWEGSRIKSIVGPRGGTVYPSYDAAGNLDGIKLTPAMTERLGYGSDDFGNTIESRVWLKAGSPLVTRWEFDAMGNEVVRETPEMRASSAALVTTRDGAGRIMRQERVSGSSRETLYVQDWDQPSISSCGSWCQLPTACSTRSRQGQLAYRADATGETWFQYDGLGRVSEEIVRPRNEPNCDASRSRSFKYRADGSPLSIRYPFGRTIEYEYDFGSRRPSSILASTFTSGSWQSPTAVVSEIHWEPFGRLAYYKLESTVGAEVASVEYRPGQTTQSATAECDLAQNDGPDTLGSNDKTGRPRALLVKRDGSLSYDDRYSGRHVFSARYEYQQQELVSTTSCLLSGAEPLIESRSYGNGMLGYANRFVPGSRSEPRFYGTPTPRLPATLTPWEEFSSIWLGQTLSPVKTSPVPVMYREILDSYDERDGTRSYTIESFDPLPPPLYAEQQIERRTLGPNGEVARRNAMFGQFDLWSEELSAANAMANGGYETVYKTVSNEFGTYEYYYDAENRRRLKIYPSGNRDEFFFAGTQLMTDVGNDEVFSPSAHPVDDYIWLDGRPLVVVRGLLDSNYRRLDDQKGDCGRNGSSVTPTGVTVGSACGFFYPVSDAQGRVAVMLDERMRVAGVGESDPYGSVNQVDLVAGTDHPYGPRFELQRNLVTGFTHAPWAMDETEVRTRLHFFAVDVEPSDDAWLEDDSNAQPLTSALERCSLSGGQCGPKMGRVNTFWAESSKNGYGPMSIRFRSGAWQSQPMFGVSVDRIEYLRSEREANAWWPPVRLPGQYFDEETGFHENWNRFFDPQTGRYLSPEPLLQSPSYVRLMAQSGMAVPIYPYAANNPLRWTDSTGFLYDVACVGPDCPDNLGNFQPQGGEIGPPRVDLSPYDPWTLPPRRGVSTGTPIPYDDSAQMKKCIERCRSAEYRRLMERTCIGRAASGGLQECIENILKMIERCQKECRTIMPSQPGGELGCR